MGTEEDIGVGWAAGGRAGGVALSVFARVLNAHILRAHEHGALGPSQLEERLGWAAEASLRVATANLRELGALAPGEERPGTTVLTAAGRELLGVAEALERWLARSAFGPISIAETPARGVVRALAAAWDSAIVQAIAERPRSLRDLDGLVDNRSYPALKRRLVKLRAANLVEPVEEGRRRSPTLASTDWLRRAVVPLAACARWERRHLPDATALNDTDFEAILLLAVGAIEIPIEASGSCVLVAPMGRRQKGGELEPAAASLVVEGGTVVSSAAGSPPSPATWVLGSVDAWLDALVDGYVDELRLRGDDVGLAAALVKSLGGLAPSTA